MIPFRIPTARSRLRGRRVRAALKGAFAKDDILHKKDLLVLLNCRRVRYGALINGPGRAAARPHQSHHAHGADL
jgi:hypothetical protein